MKILDVENHTVLSVTVVRQFLSRHSVTVVPSIAEARQVLATGKFDLLLVDYDLDDGKGDTLVREVRASDDHAIIIGVSAHDEGNAALRYAGASAICSKGELDRIQTVIERVTRKPSKQ